MGQELGVPLSALKTTGNTGIPSNDVKLDKIVGLLLCKKGFKVPAMDTKDFNNTIAYLQSKTIAADPNDRLYPILNFMSATDTTEAATVVKSGYGYKKGYNEQSQSFDVDLKYIGIGAFKNLRQWVGAEDVCAYIVDTTFIGGRKNSAGDFLPFEIDFTVKQPKIGNGKDTVTETMAEVIFRDSESLTSKIVPFVFDKNDFDASTELIGCLDLVVSKVNNTTVKVFTKVSHSDLYDKYSTQLAVAGAWKVVDAVSGAIKTGWTVAVSAANKGWAFTGLTGVNDIYLVDPTALAALNVGSETAGGFECEEAARLGE